MVDVADGSDLNKLPSIGIVSSKQDDTNCVVKDTGYTTLTRVPAIEPNRLYYVGADGALYSPAEDPGGLNAPTYWQIIARGRDSDELLMCPGALSFIAN